MHRRTFNVSGCYPLDAIHTSPVVKTSTVSSHGQMSPGGPKCTPHLQEPLFSIMKECGELTQFTMWLENSYMPGTMPVCLSLSLSFSPGHSGKTRPCTCTSVPALSLSGVGAPPPRRTLPPSGELVPPVRPQVPLAQ